MVPHPHLSYHRKSHSVLPCGVVDYLQPSHCHSSCSVGFSVDDVGGVLPASICVPLLEVVTEQQDGTLRTFRDAWYTPYAT
jgi:hypothetical protein